MVGLVYLVERRATLCSGNRNVLLGLTDLNAGERKVEG